jgi:hypothetical protein
MTAASESLMRILTKVIDASGCSVEDILAALAVLRRYYLGERE